LDFWFENKPSGNPDYALYPCAIASSWERMGCEIKSNKGKRAVVKKMF
jgi:hypothetical protein